MLIAVAADVNTQQLITYIAFTHGEEIEQVDTVRVYLSGPTLIAEVDAVMNENRTLKPTHDVAEALKFKLESLPDVQRAYVHVDHETSHKPEHFLKKDLCGMSDKFCAKKVNGISEKLLFGKHGFVYLWFLNWTDCNATPHVV